MMITRVYGSCNEFAIEFQRREGSDLEIWDAIVPANRDGQPVCGVDIPFSIISADYELIFVDTDAETYTVEDQGNCNINEHTLDALIEPQKTGIYCLRFTYKIADETWVDNYKIKVKG